MIDTILSLQQDEECLPKLIEILIDILWTFSFSTTTNIHETLQKRLDLIRWLKTNINSSSIELSLPSHGILSLIDLHNKILSKILCLFVFFFFKFLIILFIFEDHTTFNHRLSLTTNNFICVFNTDEIYQDLCITFRDRLQIEHQCSVELMTTSTCQSLDSLIQLLDHLSICIFCISTRMKTDNLAHFIHRYLSIQPNPIPILTILIENDCELEGNWLESLNIIDIQLIHQEIGRYFDHIEDNDIRLPSRTSDASTISQIRNMSPDDIRNQSRNYMNCPVPYWSPDDVTEWCEGTQGNFESLHPLVMRLNGSALVQLAEILSIEPASMYHSLNDELLQRTGSSVPLTEYVSLQSELQNLLLQKQTQQLLLSTATTPDDSNKSTYRKRRWRKSRLCTIL